MSVSLMATLAGIVPCVTEVRAFELAEAVPVAAKIEARSFAWSPSGSQLAVGGAEGIRLFRGPAFSRPRALALEGWTDSHPIDQVVWRPDSGMLAFVGPRPEDQWDTIWVTDIAGEKARDLVGDRFPDPGSRTVGTPGWVDRELIVSHHDSRSVDYWVVNLETGVYTPACSFTKDGPTHWVDGNRMALLWGHLGALAAVEINPSSDGPQTRCVEVLPGCLANTHWYSYESGPAEEAPILIARHPCDGKTPVALLGDPLFVMRALGEAPERLPFGGAPGSWSPNGRTLAVTVVDNSGGADPEEGGLEVRLVIRDLASHSILGSLRLGTVRDVKFPSGTGAFRPVWSPDGRYLVVRTPADELLLVAADGLQAHRLGRGTGADYHVRWSPDSRWLAIHHFRTLYVIDVRRASIRSSRFS